MYVVTAVWHRTKLLVYVFGLYAYKEEESKRDWAKIGKNWLEHLLYGSKLLTTSAVYCVIKMDNVNVPLEPGVNPIDLSLP